MKKVKDKHINLTEGPLLKGLLSLALPIILAQLFQIAYQFTDTFWVGRLGGNAVASVAISSPVLFFTVSLGIGLAVAGSTLTSQYFGAKKMKMVDKAASQTMLMVVVISIVFSFLGYLAAPSILKLLGAPSEIFNTALSYLSISFFGILFNFAFFVFQSIMRSIGRPKIPVYVVVATVLLNFALDPLFMFGFGPIPALGVAGVAMATIGTQSVAAIIGLSLLFSGKYGIHLHFHDFRPDFSFIKKAFKIGLPASIEQSARSLSMTVITGIVTAFGTLAVAAYGIGSNVMMLIIMIAFGITGANSAMVGQNIGANNKERAKKAAALSLRIAFISFSSLGVLAFIFAPHIIAFFVPHDQGLINIGATYLRFIAPIFGLIGIQIVNGGTLRASGNTNKAMVLTLTSQWLITIPLIYILGHHTNMGLNGVWIAFPITAVIMASLHLYVFFHSGWEKRRLISEYERLSEQVKDETDAETTVPIES